MVSTAEILKQKPKLGFFFRVDWKLKQNLLQRIVI
jgi:hypothetical protein